MHKEEVEDIEPSEEEKLWYYHKAQSNDMIMIMTIVIITFFDFALKWG